MDALTETDEADARIGRLVDERYKILQPMASGSMGAVYKGERIPVGKLVAIKFLHSSYAKDDEFLARFERETRVMSKLSHPNCVSVVDFGVWDGAPYLVMEYVNGITLRDLIDKEPLGPQRALVLARQISAGLAHAHTQGIVHRDVKPANIMISEEVGTGDHVRILDFGLARLRGNVGRDATQTNVVVGTPNYMAPEQTIGGGTIDARTDVYAVGVVLFEMITGERPFSSEDTLQLLGMHRAAPIPKLADRIDRSIALPDGVQAVIDKAMAKDPADRFQTAVELADSIDVILGPRVSAEHKIVSPRRERMRTDPAVAPTMVDVGTSDVKPAGEKLEAAPRVSSLLGNFLLLVLLLGGAVASVWYLKIREPDPAPGTAAVPGNTAVIVDAAPLAMLVDAMVGSEAVNEAINEAITDGGLGIDDDASVAAMVGDGGLADVAESDEIEMDPMSATNPDPTADTQEADDEAEDAPATTEEVEKRVPAAPVRASTVREAVQMIKDGKRDLALSSLHALWKKQPNSAYIPFLLGNIYNDKLWWSVAMDHYKIAIKKHSAYRGNSTLNRNVIKMLASSKTQRKATSFIKFTIGRSAAPYLRSAAKHEKNANVRKRAAALAKSIR